MPTESPASRAVDQADNPSAKKGSLLSKNYYRRGPDYRHGCDMGFIDIKRQFGFSSLVVGRWVNEEEKTVAGNIIFDALADLSLILNLPSSALGLRETVNLAFGKGGQPGVQAHYAPYSRTLALAKNAGAGALAHEWWHAFDHYMADKLFDRSSEGIQFASERWLHNDNEYPHPLNEALSDIFRVTLLDSTGEKPSKYVNRAIKLDKQSEGYYYSQPTEIMARAFEAWVQSRTDIKNQYLVSGTQQSETAKMGAYPNEQELRDIAPAFTCYFSALGNSLIKNMKNA